MFAMRIILCFFVCFSIVHSETPLGGIKLLMKIYDQCTSNLDVFKCLKIHALKAADRALHSKSFSLFDGVTIVKENDTFARSLEEGQNVDSAKLEGLNNGQLDALLLDTTSRFMQSHRVQVNVPRLLEEARGKEKKNMGPMLMALMAIKGSFLAMAYKAIGAMAGTALIVGKIALVLSAVLGLKKLVGSGSEKTSIEIVKIPQHTQSHTYSSSYEDQHDQHYRRSLGEGEEVGAQQRAYRGYKFQS